MLIASIPHQLIHTALQHYHVHSHLDWTKLRFSVGDQVTGWQKLEKGTVTGCTVSVVLFMMGTNLMINAALREARGPKTESGMHLPFTQGFMDNLTLTTTTHVQARWMLTALTDVTSWARMKVKAAKSRSLTIKKGKLTDRFPYEYRTRRSCQSWRAQSSALGSGLMQVYRTGTMSRGSRPR